MKFNPQLQNMDMKHSNEIYINENPTLTDWLVQNRESFQRIGSSTMKGISQSAKDMDFLVLMSAIPDEVKGSDLIDNYRKVDKYPDAFINIKADRRDVKFDFIIFKNERTYNSYLYANHIIKNVDAKYIADKDDRIALFELLKLHYIDRQLWNR